MASDPVCGMFVDERTAELTLTRENRTYYFCSTSCLQEFSAPERQLRRLRQKLVVAWPLSIVVVFLTYVYSPLGWPWVAFFLAAVVQFYPGLQFYRGTYDAVRHRVWNMDVLIAVGTTVAFVYSSAAVLLPTHLPPEYYFDASSLIVTLVLTGNYLEHLTREKARGSLRRLEAQLPVTAFVLRDGREVEIPVSEVRVADHFRVRPGARIPTDGVVVEGRSAVNESILTGESLPRAKKPGEPVLAGAINGEGLLTVEATKVGANTLLSQIDQLVAEAETSRVPLQQLADRIAARFVPFVIVLAIVASLGWILLGGVGFTIALLVFVSVVITACPCAFGIATPAAVVVGTGRAAEEGILFKGRDSLESASQINVVLSDKTGTLTRGEPTLSDLLPAPGVSPRQLLSVVAGLEAGAEHPLARAGRERARREGTPPLAFQDVRTEPGRGVHGTLDGRLVSILRGPAAMEESVDLGPMADEARRMESEGKTWSLVLDDGRLAGLLGFSDEVASGVPEAISALTQDGISVAMVTGDHETAARRVAQQVGISEVHAGMTPQDKLALIQELQQKQKRVAFVGDGINDAPALARADLGIAIGAGTDVAKETGGVVLVRSDFRGVALALRTGRRTVDKVRGNLTWALGYNSVLLPVAAGALVPLFGLGIYNFLPIAGALAMALSSTSVVLNSLSLRWVSLAR